MEWLALILFLSIFLLILYGFPVAFTMGGISLLYAVCFIAPESLAALPARFMGVMSNPILIAVPLFIFMGIMLEKSGLAESLLESMAMLFGRVPGGLAISVVVVGALLAASTGIVGATVVTMGLISLPTMLKRNYQTELATGTIAAAGTLGQIIPPSIVLVLLGDTLQIPVGTLFKAALLPGLLLVAAYMLYILVKARIQPEQAPAIPAEEIAAYRKDDFWKKTIQAFLLPLLLIIAVLGSIFSGVASATEASAIGAAGACLLTLLQRKFSLKVLKQVMQETTKLTTMVFMILLGATTFSFVFRTLGGDRQLIELVQGANLSPMLFLVLVMIAVFIMGFFIDFIEIIFIFVPVIAPILLAFEVDLVWVGVLLALNLQTSFLSPPFGFSLFYLKGVAPPEVTTQHLYRGIVPFLVIQVILLALVFLFPHIIYWV